MVKNLFVMQETWARSLGQEVLCRREWQSTPVFLPGEFHKQRNLAGYSLWGRKYITLYFMREHTLYIFHPSLGCVALSRAYGYILNDKGNK